VPEQPTNHHFAGTFVMQAYRTASSRTPTSAPITTDWAASRQVGSGWERVFPARRSLRICLAAP